MAGRFAEMWFRLVYGGYAATPGLRLPGTLRNISCSECQGRDSPLLSAVFFLRLSALQGKHWSCCIHYGFAQCLPCALSAGKYRFVAEDSFFRSARRVKCRLFHEPKKAGHVAPPLYMYDIRNLLATAGIDHHTPQNNFALPGMLGKPVRQPFFGLLAACLPCDQTRRRKSFKNDFQRLSVQATMP